MRTYSEREVADIIERAAERQAAAPHADDRPGLTLDEIERIGAEAGLDPAALRAAASEIDAAGRTLSRQASQTSTQVVVERWIDGPLTPEGWEDAVVELQGAVGPDMSAMMGMAAPQQQQIGRAYEWTHTSGLGIRTTVLASPRGDRTRLRLTQLVGLASPVAEGVGFGGLLGLGGMFVAGIAATEWGASGGMVFLAALAALVLVTAVSAPLIAHFDRRWRAGKLRDLGALADRLGPVLVPPGALPVGAESAAEREAPLRDAFESLDGDPVEGPESAREADLRNRGRA